MRQSTSPAEVPAAAPKQANRFSIRELLVAVAGVCCILGGLLIYGIVGAALMALVLGLFLVVVDRRTRRIWLAFTGIVLAILSLSILGLMVTVWLLLGESVEIAQPVLHFAAPLSESVLVMHGVVSAEDRELPNGIEVIQVDSSIGPGWASGPLFDLEGKLIGIGPIRVGQANQNTSLFMSSRKMKEIVIRSLKDT